MTHQFKIPALALVAVFALGPPLSAADDSVDIAKTIYEADLSNSNDQATLRELASRDGICEQLPEIVFPSIDKAIADLGADTFEKREAATNALISLGKKVIPKVTPLLKSKDPEVRFRAKRVLDALKSPNPQTSSTNAMRNAIYVVLNSEDDSPSNTKFLEFYFSRFNDWPKELQSLLPEAIKHSLNHPKLLDDIVALIRKTPEKDSLREKIDSNLKKFAPKCYTIITKKIHAWDALGKMKLDDYCEENKDDYTSLEETSDITEEIENINDFDAIRGAVIMEFWNSQYSLKHLWAIYLARNDLPAYVDIITDRLLSSKKRYEYGYWDTLRNLKNKSPFAKRATDLMKNGPQSFKFALQSLDSPEQYKDIIIKEMLTNSQKSSFTAWRFLTKHFPKEKKHFQQLVVDAIKRLPTPLSADDIHIRHLLRILDFSSYREHDFDKWISQRAIDSPEALQFLELDQLMILNPSPDILAEKILPIMPNDTRIHSCNITAMLRCSEENRPKVLKFLLNRFSSCRDRGIICAILNVAPELASPLTRSALKAFAREVNNNTFSSYPLESFTRLMHKRPGIIAALRGCLADNDPAIRILAAMALASRYIEDHLAGEIIKNAILSHNEPPGTEISLWEQAIWMPKRYKHDEYVAILKRILENIPKKTEEYGKYTNAILGCLSRIHVDAIPILQRELENHPDMPDEIKKDIERTIHHIKGR